MNLFYLVYLIYFTLAENFNNKTIIIDSISMDTSWFQVGGLYKSSFLIASSKPGNDCLCVKFDRRRQQFEVASLAGGYPCPSGKSIMNELISYTEEEGYKIIPIIQKNLIQKQQILL